MEKKTPEEIALEEARKAMIAKRFGGSALGASTGGEGTARRKKKGSTKAGGEFNSETSNFDGNLFD